MVPQTRAPSRALIHALRGILFTTSCSVLLLAEERRRRLKLARTALENARKLHTAKTRRRSAQLTDVRGPYDFADQLSIPADANRLYDWDTHHNGAGDDKVDNPSPSVPRLWRTKPQDTSLASNRHSLDLRGVPAIRQQVGEHMTSEWKSPEALRPNQAAHQQTVSSRKKTSARVLSAALAYVRSTDWEKSEEMVAWNAHVMKVALDKLASPDCSSEDITRIITSAIFALRETDRHRPIPKKLLNLVPRLLYAIIDHRPMELTEFVPVLLSRDPSRRMLLPLLTTLFENGHNDVLKLFIECEELKAERNPEDSSLFPRQILMAYANKEPGLDSLKRMYQTFRDMGYFQSVSAGSLNEFMAHRCLFIAAVQAGDELYAATEYEAICKFDPAFMHDDHKVHGLSAEMKARCGDWDSAFYHIERYSVFNTEHGRLNRLLNKVATTASKSGSAEDVELLLRRFFELYNLKVKRSLVLPVIDRYCSLHDITGLCSWLQFCADAGLEIDGDFLELFYKRCRKFWSFGWRDLENLDETLRAALPKISARWPSWRPRLTNNRMIAHHELARSTGDGPKRVSASKPGGKDAAFQRMLDLVDAKEWEKAYKLYDLELKSKTKFSAPCFRLAIESRIQLDGGNTDRAGELIREAFEQGHDFSYALTAFLLQKLAEGERAQTLLDNMLRLGIQIHDEVYNKAVRTLTKEGKYVAAKRVCHLAARENGEGNLAYNQYNFANLLFLLVGAREYKELEELLRNFTSGAQFWHGSKICKENVKWAMKTVGQRCLNERNQQGEDRKALDMLDAALVHIKINRATKDDRQQLMEQFGAMMMSASKTKRSPVKAEQSLAEMEQSPAEAEAKQSPAEAEAEQSPAEAEAKQSPAEVQNAGVHVKTNRATKDDRQQLVEQFRAMMMSTSKAKQSPEEAENASVDSAYA